MQLYLGHAFSEQEVQPFDVRELAASLQAEWGETSIGFRHRFVTISMAIPAVLTRWQRLEIRRRLLQELNRLSPANRFIRTSLQRVGSEKHLRKTG